MSTIIDKAVLTGIRHFLEEAYPNEACGFLIGIDNKRIRHITQWHPAENTSQENLRRRFVIDPLAYLKAEREIEASGQQLLGIFHSHPDHPAIPSMHDLEYAQPFFSYFIHSIENGKMVSTRSYRLLHEELIEEKFSIHQKSVKAGE